MVVLNSKEASETLHGLWILFQKLFPSHLGSSTERRRPRYYLPVRRKDSCMFCLLNFSRYPFLFLSPCLYLSPNHLLVFLFKLTLTWPWPVWCSWLGIILQSIRSLVRYPARPHHWFQVRSLVRVCPRRQLINVSLSSFSLFWKQKKKKIIRWE